MLAASTLTNMSLSRGLCVCLYNSYVLFVWCVRQLGQTVDGAVLACLIARQGLLGWGTVERGWRAC